ncbi:olfactory receptor 5P68-like [Lithobates pipiens]
MKQDNSTNVKEFILLAFTNLQHFQFLLFVLVLIMYNTCLAGNLMIIFLVTRSSSLHKPMYFFISDFAILEVIFVSVIVPKLLDILITSKHVISFIGCFVQLYVGNSTGIIECYLLTVMAYDRHLAIHSPLLYTSIMNQIKVTLAILPWVAGFVLAGITTLFTACLEFCGPNELDHFFCDMAPLHNLSCSDPFLSNLVTNVAAVFVILLPFTIIIYIYTHIIITVSKIKSEEGMHKAFLTCTSHLTVASLFFLTCIIVYLQPSGSQYDKYFALVYLVFTPTLNPFIYTLRNSDVKTAFYRLFSSKF